MYPDCKSHTKFNALLRLQNLKVKHHMSDAAYSNWVELIGDFLPEGNEIPDTYSDAKKSLLNELKNNKIFEFFIELEVFGYTRKSWIFDLDLHRMASMTEINGNCIMAYQRYLYDVLKNTKMLDMIAFVDLATVGEGCGTVRSKAEHLCVFITSKPGQLFMVPYNSNQHWMLTIVESKKEKVYYMDPLRRWLPIASAEWKYVINSAIAKYNTEKGRLSLNAVAWKNLEGVPHQPDHFQYGFYVMWVMRDIIHDHVHFFVTKWDKRNKLVYTQDDLDVSRNEWSKFIINKYL
ncbi:hypothetical protein ACLB2K_006518 [Fragaria x ananassa]